MIAEARKRRLSPINSLREPMEVNQEPDGGVKKRKVSNKDEQNDEPKKAPVRASKRIQFKQRLDAIKDVSHLERQIRVKELERKEDEYKTAGNYIDVDNQSHKVLFLHLLGLRANSEHEEQVKTCVQSIQESPEFLKNETRRIESEKKFDALMVNDSSVDLENKIKVNVKAESLPEQSDIVKDETSNLSFRSNESGYDSTTPQSKRKRKLPSATKPTETVIKNDAKSIQQPRRKLVPVRPKPVNVRKYFSPWRAELLCPVVVVKDEMTETVLSDIDSGVSSKEEEEENEDHGIEFDPELEGIPVTEAVKDPKFAGLHLKRLPFDPNSLWAIKRRLNAFETDVFEVKRIRKNPMDCYKRT